MENRFLHFSWGPLDDESSLDLGTCGGCGAYGPLGNTHTRNGEECGIYA